MAMLEEKLAIIVPTRNRPDRLGRLLKSISFQEVYPVQIIIVDGGELPAEQVVGKFPKLHIDYLKTPGSLTSRRNIGIKNLNKEITLVAFFDDDVELKKDSFKNMMRFWESASSDIGGASFNNISDIYKKPNLFESIFLINDTKPGRILNSGFQSKLCSLSRTTYVQWLAGGTTLWRRNIFDEFMFDEWFSGYALYEDVDFSFRVGKKYKLYVVAQAEIVHKFEFEKVGKSFLLGKIQVVNRLYFVKKNHELSRAFCYWACIGLFLKNMLLGTVGMNPRYLLRGLGVLSGIISSFVGLQSIKEEIKP